MTTERQKTETDLPPPELLDRCSGLCPERTSKYFLFIQLTIRDTVPAETETVMITVENTHGIITDSRELRQMSLKSSKWWKQVP